jgi:acyl-CoA thioesterase
MNKSVGKSYFRQQGEVFVANDPARGPWSRDHCHAGPVAALMVRAAEQLLPDDLQPARLALDLLRPVPTAGLTVQAEILRHGRSLATVSVDAYDQQGRQLAVARVTFLTTTELGAVPSVQIAAMDFSASVAGEFPLSKAHNLPCFTDACDVRYPPKYGPALGPKAIWMRCPPLLKDEVPSPFQLLCPIADSSNGISGNGNLDEFTFVNTDLTIVMHRPPQMGWLASDARSFWQTSGVGLAESTLHDVSGPVAGVMQTLLLRRR